MPFQTTLAGPLKAHLLALATIALALAVVPGSAGAAGIGAVPDLTWGTPRSDVDKTIVLLKESGVRSVRMNASWSAIEQQGKGRPDPESLADLDYAVREARAAGLDVLMPIADGVPYWASADPDKHSDASGQHWNRLYRPEDFDDYADFARFIVNRYEDDGVKAFQVWNEPNLEHFWPSGTSAREYFQMLSRAYPAIKRANGKATVVLGGLSKSDYTYLNKLYGMGAKRYFDVAAVHPYTGSASPDACWREPGTNKLAKDAFCGIEQIRKTMVANGDSAAPLWLTEFGWSTYSGEWGVSETTQADYLVKAFQRLERYGYVKKAFVYNFRNTYWMRDEDSIEAQFGLLRTDFTPKPAFAALKAYATGL